MIFSEVLIIKKSESQNGEYILVFINVLLHSELEVFQTPTGLGVALYTFGDCLPDFRPVGKLRYVSLVGFLTWVMPRNEGHINVESVIQSGACAMERVSEGSQHDKVHA